MYFRLRLPIRAVAAAALALAGVLMLPGGASATCGDYVHIQTDDPPAPPRPCHGPQCSKAPATPIVPMTAPVPSSSESEQPSLVVDTEPGGRPSAGWAAGHTRFPLPIRLTSSIFHPPRAI
jgi:hypothetical protein